MQSIIFKNLKSFKVDYLVVFLSFVIPSGFYKLSGYIIGLIILLSLYEKRYLIIKRESLLKMASFFLFFSLFIFSLFHTENFKNGLGEIEQHLSVIIFPLIFISFNLTEKLKIKIKGAFVLSSILFVLFADIYAVWDILLSETSTISINQSIYFKYSSYGLTRIFNEWHPTYVSLFLCLSTLFILEFELNIKNRYKIIVVIFISLNIFLLNSLTGIITLMIMLSAYVFYYNKYIFIIFMGLAIVGLYTLPYGNPKLEKITSTQVYPSDRDNKNSLNLRLAKWKTSVDVIKQNPVFGVSPGDVKNELLNQYIRNKFFFCAEKKFGPHNQYLQILTSFGLFGFVIFNFLIFSPLMKNFSKENLYFVLIFCLFFLTEDVLEREQGLFAFTFLYSMNNLKSKIEKQGYV